MRTKALLLGAAIGAISLASAMAQVYSVNIVGYINVTIPPGYAILANQLNNANGNNVSAIFGTLPVAVSVYKFDKATQIYQIANWDVDFQAWDNDFPLNPGDGFFTYSYGTTNVIQTFVGEVKTGTTTIDLQQGLQLLSVVVPQSGKLQQDLNWVPSTSGGGDVIYKFNSATQIYDIYNYDADFQEWQPGDPEINVGEGFFVSRGQVGGTWTRTFNVGP